MPTEDKITDIQKRLDGMGIDGWLLADFRHSNELALRVLGISPKQKLSRRLYYWIPSKGEPTKIVHSVEPFFLDHLPGKKEVFFTWGDLNKILGKLLPSGAKVAMEYSPKNALPYVSKVDGGTVELVESFGVKVVSSADLLQHYTSCLTQEEIGLHYAAEKVLDLAVDGAWNLVRKSFKSGERLTEFDIQSYILGVFEEENCVTEGKPIVAVNAHAADPHYEPQEGTSAEIKEGDVLLIDLWAKKNVPNGIFADYTRMAVVGSAPTDRQEEIFSIVAQARDAAVTLVEERYLEEKPVQGYEVDRACRKVVEDAGYGKYFVHRTGHNIHYTTHGDGAHIDDVETHDHRNLIPSTCFSIEPGIYLPDEFGVRLEVNVLIHSNCRIEVTGVLQQELACLL